MIKDEFCLVTGGAGSIGSEIVRQLAPENSVFILDNNETEFFNLYEELNQQGFQVRGIVGDVRDSHVFDKVRNTFGEFPKYVFHCAALKHVTPSQWSPEEYTKTNVLGTLNVLQYNGDARIVNISTDKVVNANSIMGATKRVAEIAVRDAGHVSVRFGNVMGSRGSVLEIWQRQIDEGRSLTVTDRSMTRYMMTIPDAVKLVIRAAEIGESGDILVMDMGEKVNILELAKEILDKSGTDGTINIIGKRPGETLSEILLTPEEKKHAKRVDNFWIIRGENNGKKDEGDGE